VERDALKRLAIWRDVPGREPLLLRGARQAGKTRLAKEFGRRYFENIVRANFDLYANPAGYRAIHSVFEQDIRNRPCL
jgi:predicted AAA+ superfamily ATPase